MKGIHANPEETVMVRISEYPQLRRLCWNRKADMVITDEQAMQIYTRNWRHVDEAQLGENEVTFIENFRQARLAQLPAHV